MFKKKGNGRKPRQKYDPIKTPKLVYKYAREGYNNKEIAELIGITDTTLSGWIHSKDEVKEAIQSGRAFILPELEKSMLKAALGYHAIEETVQFTARPLRGGNTTGPQFVESGKTISRKWIPPNVQMQKYLANNRHPEHYKEKSEIEVKVTDISPEDLEAFEKALIR